MLSTLPHQVGSFLTELSKLSKDTQLCLARILGEIDEVGLGHIGGCPWRETHQQLMESLPALKTIAPSAQIVSHQHRGLAVMYQVQWTPCEFYMPYSPELTLLWKEISDKSAAHRGDENWSVML